MAESEDYQSRLYNLLSQLQRMAASLPGQYQQRMPYELLSELAASLAQGQILEIVRMLVEVQHATEKHLFQQRLHFTSQQKGGHNSDKVSAERREHDMKLIKQLDAKVSEQQATLERAGVPGFFVTNNPTEVQVQMYLLDFIIRIGNGNTWSQKAK